MRQIDPAAFLYRGAAAGMLLSVSSFTTHVQPNLEWADQARGPARGLDRLPATAAPTFFPAAKRRHSSRKAKKQAFRRSPLRCGLKAAG